MWSCHEAAGFLYSSRAYLRSIAGHRNLDLFDAVISDLVEQPYQGGIGATKRGGRTVTRSHSACGLAAASNYGSMARMAVAHRTALIITDPRTTYGLPVVRAQCREAPPIVCKESTSGCSRLFIKRYQVS
jgi:hypothetical protein